MKMAAQEPCGLLMHRNAAHEHVPPGGVIRFLSVFRQIAPLFRHGHVVCNQYTRGMVRRDPAFALFEGGEFQ